MIERAMQPYWQGTAMFNESVLMVSDHGKAPEANLLFPPMSIISVRNARLDIEYEQGIDWVLENGTLKLTANTRIPYLTYQESSYTSYIPGTTMPKKDGGAVLYHEESFFHDRQIAVTYTHAGNQWAGPVPEASDTKLPNTFCKLKNRESLRVVLYGDSISVGANSSGFVNVPPYLPIWGQLVADGLAKYYKTHVTFINESVGGQTSQWGAQNAASLVASRIPDLVMIAFGMNDGAGTGIGDGIDPEIYKNNIRSIMESVRQVNPAAEFILVGTTLPNPETIFFDRQPAYFAKLDEIVRETDGTAAANMTAVHQELLRHKKFVDMTGNNINHPNDFLSRWYAQFILGMLKDSSTV